MMYNEEAKKNISNYNITYRYFRFFAKSVVLHIVEKNKILFCGLESYRWPCGPVLAMKENQPNRNPRPTCYDSEGLGTRL